MDGNGGAADEHFDFFISRTGANSAFAIWLRALLVAQGKRVVMQDEDFESRNFVDAMLDGLRASDRVIAIYSPEYFNSQYCEFEWKSAIGEDLANRSKRLMPLMLEACAPHKAIRFLGYKPLMDLRRQSNPSLLAREILAWLRVPVLTLDGVPPLPEGILRGRKPIVDRHNIYAQPDFVGREDLLAEIARRIGPEATALGNASRTGLSGLGGVGKTTLARRFAWDFQDHYHGVWWVRADTIDNVHADLGRLGAELSEGLKALAVTNPEKAARDTLDWLEQAPLERPWLIVYDNAEAGIKDLHTLMPTRNAHVLVTTRAEKLYGVADPIDVDVLPPEAAADYLLMRTGREGEVQRAAAVKLADVLDHLPLALDHAAAFCAGSGMSFDEYAKNLGALLHERPADDRYPDSVYGTFTLAIDKAAAQCRGAETLMGWLAFLAPDDIPLAFFGEDVMPVVDLRKAVAALAGVSLIDKGTDDTSGTVSVHRLVQVVMRARLAGEGKGEAVAAAVTQIVQRAFRTDNTFDGLAFNARWLPHGLAVIDHAPQDGEAASSTLWTLLQIGIMRVRLGDLASAMAVYQRALDLAQVVSASLPESTQWQRDLSVSQEKIGDVLRAQGNLSDALEAFNASLDIRKRLAVADPGNAGWQRDLSVSHNKIGDVLTAQGNLSDALEAFNASLDIRKRLALADPGNAGWQRDVAVSHAKLASLHRKAGDIASALGAIREGRAIMVQMVALSPDYAEWKRDLAWFDGQVAALEAADTSSSSASPAEAKPRAGVFPAPHEDPGSPRSDVPSDRLAGDAETMGTPTEQTPASPAEAKPRAGAFPAAHEDPGSTRSDVPSDRSAGDAETMRTPTEQTPASPGDAEPRPGAFPAPHEDPGSPRSGLQPDRSAGDAEAMRTPTEQTPASPAEAKPRAGAFPAAHEDPGSPRSGLQPDRSAGDAVGDESASIVGSPPPPPPPHEGEGGSGASGEGRLQSPPSPRPVGLRYRWSAD